MSYLLQFKRVKFFIIGVISVFAMLLFAFTTNAGGGGGSGGSSSSGQNTRAQTGTHAVTSDRNLANSVARDMNSRPNSMCNNCSATVTSNRDGTVSVSVRENDRGGNDNRTSSSGTPGGGTTPTCTNNNLTTIDIFFVRAGAQPVTTPARTVLGARNSTWQNDRARTVIPATVSYTSIIIPRNELQVGVQYEPIAQIRNSAPCSSYNASDRGGNFERAANFGAFLFVPTVYAGGGSSAPRVNDYPNNIRTQLPFGSRGSFPIRARIDVGNNTIIDWEHYLNAIGPVTNGQTIYLRLPAFSTSEVGTHSVEIVTDIRHSVDPGRGCYATTTRDSAGLGCIRETSERDNDRRETFTTIGSSTSATLTVDVEDTTASAGSVLTQLPFAVTNTGVQNIVNYRYNVRINSTLFASTTRTTTLTPGERENTNAGGSFTVPNTPSTIPFTVCARVGTSTESCDTARINVVVPQCSDRRDNDGDATADTTDTGCFTNPGDPSTYDPNDNSESDAGTLVPPEITLEADNTFVRSNTRANITYRIRATYPLSCTLTGPGITSTFAYTSGTLERALATDPLINKQLVTISCIPSAVPPGSYNPTTRELIIEIVPQIQEV
jgi:hypothetical protein